MIIYVIEFVLLYLVSYGFYYVMYLRNGKKKNKKMDLAEAKILVKLYNIDMKKVSYDKLCKVICLIISFNLALTVFIAYNVPLNIFLKVLVGIGILSISTILTYRFLGMYYTNKGLVKNIKK